MFAVVTEVTGGDWAAFRLTDDFDAAAALASLAFVAYTVGMTSMRFGGDWLQLRLGRIGLHRLSVGLVLGGFAVASLVPNEAASIVGFLLVGLGVATFLPKLYDDAARLPGRRGAGLGAMTAGMRVAYLVTPVAVGALAATSLSVGEAIAIFTLPATDRPRDRHRVERTAAPPQSRSDRPSAAERVAASAARAFRTPSRRLVGQRPRHRSLLLCTFRTQARQIGTPVKLDRRVYSRTAGALYLPVKMGVPVGIPFVGVGS